MAYMHDQATGIFLINNYELCANDNETKLLKSPERDESEQPIMRR